MAPGSNSANKKLLKHCQYKRLAYSDVLQCNHFWLVKVLLSVLQGKEPKTDSVLKMAHPSTVKYEVNVS